jgi:hypothetical protein
MTTIATILLLLLLGIVGLAMFLRMVQMRELAARGVLIIGTVLERKAMLPGALPRLSNARRIQYIYKASTGAEYKATARVSPAEWGRLAEGGAIELVYLPDRPRVCAVKEAVEKLRGPD